MNTWPFVVDGAPARRAWPSRICGSNGGENPGIERNRPVLDVVVPVYQKGRLARRVQPLCVPPQDCPAVGSTRNLVRLPTERALGPSARHLRTTSAACSGIVANRRESSPHSMSSRTNRYAVRVDETDDFVHMRGGMGARECYSFARCARRPFCSPSPRSPMDRGWDSPSFGPGSIRPFDGAQIWGGPTTGFAQAFPGAVAVHRSECAAWTACTNVGWPRGSTRTERRQAVSKWCAAEPAARRPLATSRSTSDATSRDRISATVDERKTSSTL